jgi:hypothetical protein
LLQRSRHDPEAEEARPVSAHPASNSDALTALLFVGALAVVVFRRAIALWVGVGLFVLLVLAALSGH